MELDLVLPKRTLKKLPQKLLTRNFAHDHDQHGVKKYREMGDGSRYAVPLHSQVLVEHISHIITVTTLSFRRLS